MQKSLLACLLLSLLAACLPSPRDLPQPSYPASRIHPWAGALRVLDPADTRSPAYDITAVYLRRTEGQLQIRVDLLDFQKANDLFLDLNIGDASDPAKAPFLIHFPSEGNSARFTLDPLLATVILELPLSGIPTRPIVDVSTPEDQVTGLTLDGPVPAQTASLLLTFYNTFATRFPAEALRSWDGAHTGPRGERHGLRHLLDAAQEYQTPIVLLDLKKPEILSALDAMGLLPQIQHMQQGGLLLLPDQPEQQVQFGFSPTSFSWGGLIANPPHKWTSRPTFVISSDPSHLYSPLFSKTTFIPVATGIESSQPTPDGPSLEVRRALLDLALNTDEKDLLVLGGNLRDSTWGSPDMAGPALAYFANRPYIHILAADDLLNFPTKAGKPELRSSPEDDSLRELAAHYQVLIRPVLEFVANWKGSPLSSCASDLDKDGQPECVLANENFIAIFDPQGARLVYWFSVGRVDRKASPQGDNPPYTQLIGPSWQVAVGLSNPSTWDLSAGEAADPGAYPGAFADMDDPYKNYEPDIDGSKIVFRSKDGTRIKTFSLNENGLEVKYQTQEAVTTQIPLLVEPGIRFTNGWAGRYRQEKTPGGVAWGLENGPMVRIKVFGADSSLTRDPVTMRAFNESLSLLAGPEDPDFDYPPGHYIPFPMAIAEVEMRDDYFLRLERFP